MNNSAKQYLENKKKGGRTSYPKDKKLRFDLAEGLWEKSKLASLPDRSSQAAKNAVGKFLNVRPAQVSVFAGADDAIEIIPRIYLNPRDSAVVITPVFDRVISTNQKAGARVVLFRLAGSRNFELGDEDLGRLQSVIEEKSPKITWFCSPNNPTGQVIEKKYIEKIAKRFPKMLVVVDEAYQEYFSMSPKDSSVALVNKHKNIVVLRSFSKAFGLAGVRAGCVVGDEREIAKFENYRTMFNVSTIAQDMIVKSLSPAGLKKVKGAVKRVVLERERLVSKITALKNIKLIEKSRTNFLFLKHNTKDLFEALYAKGIVCSDWRAAPGIIGEGFVRVAVNKPDLNRTLVSALKEID